MQASVVLRDSVLTTDQLYDYRVPPELAAALQIGQFVDVPFGGGNRSQTALVTDIYPDRETKYELKNITRIVDEMPVLFPDQMAILPNIRSRFGCTYGDAIRLMVPASVTSRNEKSLKTAFLTDPHTTKALLA